jgi:hypothetical protein
MVRVTAAAGSSKRQVRPPTDHFEKLLDQTCPNHTYAVKNKLRDYDKMKNFMASRSLTQGMEVDEVPDEGGATPLPGEDVVMMIYDGCPSLVVHHVPNPCTGTPTQCGWGVGMQGCKDISFPISLYNNICRNMDMYIIATPNAKEKTTGGIAWGHGGAKQAKF